MRKSQLITLVILFLAVSIFIWVGACSDKRDEGNSPSTGTIKVNAPATDPGGETPDAPATPTPQPGVQKPAVDFTQVDSLGKNALTLDVSQTEYKFTDAATVSAMEKYTYILSKPGVDTKDIYMTFLLHYSEANPQVIKLLDLAKEKNVKFTFFVSSMYLSDEKNLDVLKRMHDEGHTIGTRGDKSIDQLTASSTALFDSLWAMEQKYQSIFGANERMYFYAPDSVSERNMKLANLMEYTVTFKLCNFVTNAGSQPQATNGVVFQSSEISDALVTEVTGYVDWGLSQQFTFKGLSK